MNLDNALLHLISHQCSNRPANFMILWTFSQRAEQDEKKPVQHKGQQFSVKSFSNEAFRELSAHLSRLGTEYGDREAETSRGIFQQRVYNLVVMGTSARPLSSTAGARRTKATTGRSKNSSSPTRTLDASAPGGIFFMKWRSICETERNRKNTISLERLVQKDCGLRKTD